MTIPTMDNMKNHFTDASAVAVAGATVLHWLPEIAALFSVVWTVIRIYETKTFQAFLDWFRSKLARPWYRR
jgi:hypothetical protein